MSFADWRITEHWITEHSLQPRNQISHQNRDQKRGVHSLSWGEGQMEFLLMTFLKRSPALKCLSIEAIFHFL
jgi:hypothetical protein